MDESLQRSLVNPATPVKLKPSQAIREGAKSVAEFKESYLGYYFDEHRRTRRCGCALGKMAVGYGIGEVHNYRQFVDFIRAHSGLTYSELRNISDAHVAGMFAFQIANDLEARGL